MRIAIAAAALLLSLTAYAQQRDLYSRITPLENSLNSGTATHAEKLELAQLYVDAGRQYEAVKLTDGLIAADPNDAEAQRIHDTASSQLRDAQNKKIADAQANAKRSGATDQDQLALADAYYEGGSYGAAADLYAHLPSSVMDRDARTRYARSLAWSGQHDRAERVYSQLIAEQSTPDLELEYGRVLSWMGASRAAIDTLQKAYNAHPTQENAIALANAMAWSGDRDGAIRLLDNFAQSNPNAAEAAALSAQFRSSPDLRLERIDRMIAAQPYNLALQVEKARLLMDANRSAEALQTIDFVRQHSKQKIEGLDDIEQRAKTNRQAELARLEEQLKALDSSPAMTSASSGNGDTTLALAKGFTGVGAYDRSEMLYERYLRAHPDDAEARLQYARVLSWDRKWGASERQYEKLLAANPDRADIEYEYAQVLSYDSDYGPAIDRFQHLTDLSANPRAHLYTDVPAKSYYNLGQIYRWYGWNETAAYDQNRALALDPGYVPARTELDLVRHLRPSSVLDGRYTYTTDSDDFTLKRADLAASKWTSQRTEWDLGVGRHDFEHAGDSVSANVLSGGAAYRLSDRLTARARAGVNFYDQGLGTRPFFGAGAEWLPSITSRASLDFNHYDLVYDVFTLTSLALPAGGSQINLHDPISINDFRGHYDWNGGGFFSALGDASYGFISDSNRRAAAHGLLTLRVWKAPFIAVKADGRYLSYDTRTNRYWSPPDYHSFAGVLQIGQNFRNRFFVSVEGKAGRAWEQGFSSDLRAYEATVTVPMGDALDLVGNYGYGKSGRFNSLNPITGNGTDFINYWQRHWYVGVRVKQLFSRNERMSRNPYYYDNQVLGGSSPVTPFGDSH